jgi:hypothetical protein
MGRLLGIVMVCLFAGGIASADDKTAGIRNLLQQAQRDFLDLAADLPFGRVGLGREQLVRDRFKEASRNLDDAVREVGRDDERSRELTKTSLLQFRKVGLFLPFYEIDLPDEAMDKYIGAEDRLIKAGRVFEGVTPPPTTDEVWRTGGLAWKAVKGKFSLREAQEKCGQVIARQTAGWHVPSLDELWDNFRAMKSSSNPIFGVEAKSYREVWTEKENDQAPGTYYFVDFQKEAKGVSGTLTPHQVVCVGRITSAS